MKVLTLISLGFLISCNAISQGVVFPDGVYLNTGQLKLKRPGFNADLNIRHRTKGDIFLAGGNDFNIESGIDSVDQNMIDDKVLAYVKHDSLFLNCSRIKIGCFYSLGLSQGPFIAFKAGIPDKDAHRNAAMGGAIGGAIGGGINAKKRNLYVLSLRTGNVWFLTKEYIMNRLKESQILLSQFKNEKKQDSETVLLKYINLLNDVTPIDSESPDEETSE